MSSLDTYYLKAPNFPGYINKENVTPIIQAYVDKDVLPCFWAPGKGAFAGDFFKTKAAIYASSYEELRHELATFRDFPGCLDRFGWNSRSYRNEIKSFKSYKGGNYTNYYMYKQDVYGCLIHQINYREIYANGEYPIEMINRFCSLYMKFTESRLLKGHCEFTLLEPAEIAKFKQRLTPLLNAKPDEMKQVSYVNVKKAIKKVFTEVTPNLEMALVDNLLDEFESNLSFSKYRNDYENLVHYVTIYLTEADKFIKSKPDWFTAKGEHEAIRRFENGGKKFFFAKDILNELRRNKLNGGQFQLYLESLLDELSTISLEDTESKWKKYVKDYPFSNVEVIHVEIKRTKHHAIYIPYNKTHHCILVADAFMELLRKWISVKGIFQVIDSTNWPLFRDTFLCRLFELEPKLTKMRARSPMFIDVERVKEIDKRMEEILTDVLGNKLKQVKDFEPIGEEALDLDGLKDRFIALNISTCFPEITNFVTHLYNAYKAKRDLTLCDVYELFEQYQLMGFLLRVPDRYEWLTIQGFDKIYPFHKIGYDSLKFNAAYEDLSLRHDDIYLVKSKPKSSPIKDAPKQAELTGVSPSYYAHGVDEQEESAPGPSSKPGPAPAKVALEESAPAEASDPEPALDVVASHPLKRVGIAIAETEDQVPSNGYFDPKVDTSVWFAGPTRKMIAKEQGEASTSDQSTSEGPPAYEQPVISSRTVIVKNTRYDRMLVSPGYITQANIMPVLKAYIDEDYYGMFQPSIYGFEGDYTKTRAGYYAKSSNEMYRHLDKFRNFAGCLQRFGWDSRIYRMKCSAYSSFFGRKPNSFYFYKQDSYTFLMDQMPTNEIQSIHARVVIELIDSLCAIFLRYKEENLLGGHYELAEIYAQNFDAFATNLSIAFSKECKSNTSTYMNCVKAIKKSMANVCPKIDLAPVDALMRDAETKISFNGSRQEWTMVVNLTTNFVKEADSFIKKHSTWFVKNKNYTSLLRRFESCGKKFFLASELLDEIRTRELDGGSFQLELECMEEMETLSYNEAKTKWDENVPGEKFDEIEVIQTEIKRTKHRAIFIPYDKTKHCILAVDAFTELIRKWISKGIFQDIDKYEGDEKQGCKGARFYIAFFSELFKFEPKFQKMTETPMFLDVDRVKEINEFMKAKMIEKYGQLQMKDAIRDVRPFDNKEYFDYTPLAERIRELGLSGFFPDCYRFVRVILDRAVERRPVYDECKTTCDAYDVIEHGILLNFWNRHPNIGQWFKCQAGDNLLYPDVETRYDGNST